MSDAQFFAFLAVGAVFIAALLFIVIKGSDE